MAERRFADAADAYAQLAARFPGEPGLQANLGMALHLSAQDDDAVGPLTRAASAMPSSFPAHFYLGASFTRLQRFSDAVEPLRHAVRLAPQEAFARALLGDALEAVAKYSEAADAWRGLSELDPSSPYASAGLARTYEQLAVQATQELIRRDPESPLVLRLLARSRLADGQLPSALYLFRQALARSPDVRSVHEAIADLYDASGHADWAAAERRRAASLPPVDCSSTSTPECSVMVGSGNEAAGFSPDWTTERLFWAARANAMLSGEAYLKLRQLEPSVDQLALVAGILSDHGKFLEASEAYRRALAMRPGNGTLERQFAEALFLARRGDEARPLLERFLDSDPQDPMWPAMLGNLLAQEQDFELAVPLLEQAVSFPDHPPSARTDLGRSYLSLGRAEEAAETLLPALGADTDGSIHYQLAQAYVQLGRREAAQGALAKYRELEARSRRLTEASAELEITPPE